MANPYDVYVDAAGEIEEFSGARELLPESYYPMKLSVNEVGQYDSKQRVNPETGDIEVIPATPYLALTGVVQMGPFKGLDSRNRVNLSPGGPASKGGFMGFLVSMVKQVTGMPVDTQAMADHQFPVPEFPADADDRSKTEIVRRAFRDGFHDLDDQAKVEFMKAWARLGSFEGKVVIVKVGIDSRARKDDTGAPMVDPTTGQQIMQSFNTWDGFFGLEHPKKGLEWWRAEILPMQEAAVEESVS